VRAVKSPPAPAEFRFAGLAVALDQLADALAEGIDAERLGQHVHARAEEIPAYRGVRRIAGDEQHLQLRTLLAREVGELAAVEAGQAEVADQQIDALLALQVGQGGGASQASSAT